VYLGEKQHDDPKFVTESHHQMLSSLLGRYTADSIPMGRIMSKALTEEFYSCVTVKMMPMSQWCIVIDMDSQALRPNSPSHKPRKSLVLLTHTHVFSFLALKYFDRLS